ncbi:flagellar motor switch protein FliM [Endozoicomonas sp. Mp262]|uniref:flagellar motor switch protein FliM n=1 Tax=Endozoicomonas sp. Mp262 TaxID=2919499 RepID=UPI0021D9BAFB
MKESVMDDAISLMEAARKNTQKAVSEAADAKVKTLDITNPGEKIHDLVPILELIFHRFSSGFQASIYNFLHHDVEIHFDKVSSLKYGDYEAEPRENKLLEHLFNESTLNFSGFFAMDIPLIVSMVDLFFGGSGQVDIEEGRDMTPAEMRMVRRCLKMALEHMCSTWEMIIPFEGSLPDYHSNPVSRVFISSSELILVARMRIKMLDREGEFHIVLPYKALVPVREQLHAFQSSNQDSAWRNTLWGNVKGAKVELNARLCHLQMSLEQVLKLETGDIILADMPESIDVSVGGIPCLQVSVCEKGGVLALKVYCNMNQNNMARDGEGSE